MKYDRSSKFTSEKRNSMQRRENEGGNAQNIAKGVLVSELSLGNEFALQRCVLQFANALIYHRPEFITVKQF